MFYTSNSCENYWKENDFADEDQIYPTVFAIECIFYSTDLIKRQCCSPSWNIALCFSETKSSFFHIHFGGNLFLKFNELMNGAAETHAPVSHSLQRVQVYALRWDLIEMFFSSVKSRF